MRRPKTPDTGPPRALGYIRVSTGKQVLSPEVQEEKIRHWAAFQELELLEVIRDQESAKEGSLRKRPGVQVILEMAKQRKIDRLIVAKLDRLTRSVVDLGTLLTELDKYDVGLMSAAETWMDTSSAAGRLVIHLITCVSQWEREVIGERTAAAHAYRKKHHQVYSPEPYGWRREGSLLKPIKSELDAIAWMHEMRNSGRTLEAIAVALTKAQVPTKKPGGKWYKMTVSDILKHSTPN